MPFETVVRADRQGSLLGKLRKPQYQPGLLSPASVPPGLQHRFIDAIAVLAIYSMAVDGPARSTPDPGAKEGATKSGFLAGSKALDSLATFMMSKELLFHPSQSSSVTRSVCKS